MGKIEKIRISNNTMDKKNSLFWENGIFFVSLHP